MKNPFPFCCALLVMCLPAAAQISSTFDADADGWTFLNSTTSVPVVHSAAGGNPIGRVTATYSSNTSFTTQNWIAPAKFLGNHLARSLGMTLNFDLQQSQAGTTGGFDVRIESGSAFIYFVLLVKPAVAPAWTSYSLTLDESIAWKNGAGGATATRDQIISILRNVTSIEIRGTYATNASYTSGLDNVVLDQRTLPLAPAATSLSTTSGKPGDVITIMGSGFDASPSSNTVSFGTLAGTKATVQSASSTQLEVVVPAGASYGPLTITNNTTGLSVRTATPFVPLFDGGGRIIPASFRDKFAITTIGIEGWFVGDFDGDGWEDFAVANNNTDDVIDIYRNLGLGGNLSTASFDTKVSVAIPPLGGSGTNGAGLWFADLDGDGMLDAVSSNATSAFNSAFITLRNTSIPGNLAFEAPEYWAGVTDETPINLITDLDGDGRPELLAGEGSGGGTSASFFWANQNISSPGNIEFGAPIFPLSAAIPNGFAGVASGDLNGDGRNELIVSSNFGDRFTVLENTSTPGVPTFVNSFTIVTGQYNRSMRVVDVNLDGKNDLVWKKSGGGIYVRINEDTDNVLTDSDFATEFIIASDLGANGGIAMTDFNGDGKADIAITDSNDVGVCENIFAGGSFGTDSYIPAFQVLGANAGGSTSSPVVSDLNHDGKPDLIVAGAASITILENKNVIAPHISINTVSPLAAPVGATVTITGDNFSPVLADNEVWFGAVRATVLTATPTELTVTVPAGATYRTVQVRKGELSSSYHLPFSTSFSFGVTFDNTHFATPVTFALTGADYDIEVGDLDLDGKPDIVAEGSGLISRLFQNTHTSGAISSSSLTVTGTTSSSAANPKLVDVDGDGRLDLASPNGRTYPNQSTPGTISFATEITTSTGDNVGYGDLNQDGKPDLASAAPSSGSALLQLQENRSSVGVFVNNGAYGTFTSNINLGKASRGGDVTIADFDNDGFNDLVSLNPFTDNMSIFRNAQKFRVSSTLFATRIDIAVGDNPLRSYPADFDQDGKIDLLVTHWTGTSSTLLIVFQNTSTLGSISFNRIDITNPSTVTIATVADLDGDGKPEIIATSEGGNRFSIYKNLHTSGSLSSASFAAPFNTTVTAPRGITTGDLNLDGKPEIILTRAAGLLVVYENLIPSSPSPTITSFTPSSGPVGMMVTITGTNFSTTPSANVVKFNGTLAAVSASTSTSITTVVPSGATTGPISVALITGTAVSSTNFTVTASPIISITTQPSDFSTCGGPVTTFTAAATGTTNLTYQWQYSADGLAPFADITNGGGYSNATTATLSINTAGNFGSGRYRCRVNGDYAAEVITSDAGLAVNPTPTAPTKTNGSACGPASLSLGASGGTIGQYRWYTTSSGGSPLAGETNDTYVTTTLSTSVTYYVAINNGTCESARTAVLAVINTIPSAPGSTDGFTCGNGSVQVSASGANNGEYRWYDTSTGGVAISGEVNALFTTPILSATTPYYVAINNGACESARTTVTATIKTVPAKPSILSSGTSACQGGSVTLEATAANSYSWSNGETTQLITITSSGTFSVSVSDGNGCASPLSDPVTVTVSPLPAKPVISPSGATTFCSGSSVTLSAPGANAYAWSNGATTQQITTTTSGNYTVSITDGNGCVSPSSDPIVINVNPLPAKPAMSAAGATTFCEGSSVVLSSSVGSAYVWSNGATTQQITVTTTGTYGVSITDINGCTSPSSDEVSITVNAAPAKPVVTVSGSTSICTGQTITLSAPAGFTYNWSNGATTQQTNVSAGVYTVQIGNAAGCLSVDSDAITVQTTSCNQPPAITSTGGQIGLEGSLTISLIALLSDPDNNLDLSTLKIIGQPTSGAMAMINANAELVVDYNGISFSGTDVITIEVCDDQGECAQQQIQIEVQGDIIVQNGISPNGDGANDYFQIKYIDIIEDAKRNRLTIFNRWGDVVFEGNDYDNKNNVFTGVNQNGNELPSGSYFYRLEFKSARPMQTGFLVIKR